MNAVASALVLVVALEHVYFLVLEMFLWTKPAGLRAFQRTKEEQEATKVLAANQGLYNGFLAAGLVWSFLVRDAGVALMLREFFLGCVLVAGLYGAATAARKILFLQALPALVALVVVFLAHG